MKISVGMEGVYSCTILDLVTEVNALEEGQRGESPIFFSYILGEGKKVLRNVRSHRDFPIAHEIPSVSGVTWRRVQKCCLKAHWV